MFKFFGSVRNEMKNVTWPTKKLLGKYVVIVIETAILFAAFFGLVDFGINSLIKLFI